MPTKKQHKKSPARTRQALRPVPPCRADSCSPQLGRGARWDLRRFLRPGFPWEPGPAAQGLSPTDGAAAWGTGLPGEWVPSRGWPVFPPPPNPSPRVCTRAGLCLPGGEEQPPAPRAARQPRGTGVRHGARDHHGLGSRRPGEPEALLSAGGGPAGCPQCRAPRGGHGIRVRSPRLLLRGVGDKQKGWRSHEDAELVLLPMATGILRAGIYRLCKIWGRSSWL